MYRKEKNRNKQKKSYNFNGIHMIKIAVVINGNSRRDYILGLNVITAFITMWTKLFLYEFAK
jgi:hypothetical protein